MANDGDARTSLMDQLTLSRRISNVVDASDSIALRHELAVHHYDFAVLMLDSADERLPAFLLRYPDLKVLVVLPQRKIESLDLWLQQGASDVVSAQKPAALRHALSRLVDECRLVNELEQANEKIELQERIHTTLQSSHPHAIMLVCGNTVLDANTVMQSLLGIKSAGSSTQSIGDLYLALQNWIAPESRSSFANLAGNTASTFEATSILGEKHTVHIRPIQFPNDLAQLISIDPQPIVVTRPAAIVEKIATQLPTAESLNQRLNAFINTTKNAGRYTAMLVQFPELESAHSGDGVERTLQDLSMNRASEALSRCFSGSKTMLARAGKSAFLLVSPTTNRPSRSAANRVHKALGSLGGLSDPQSSIRINTLTLSSDSLDANEVIKRLESRVPR